MIILPIQGLHRCDIILSTQYSIDSMGAVDMLVLLEERQLEEVLNKRPRLKEMLDLNMVEGVKRSVWELDDGGTGKKPLMLIAKFDYGHLGIEYRLFCSQTGKNGSCYSWSLPAAMPGVLTKVIKKGGRPVTYGQEQKEQAKKLRESGLSIRKIAEQMNASTFTIQRLLKE